MCCRANIVGCIICPNASVAAGSELRDCLVGSGQSVSGNSSIVLLCVLTVVYVCTVASLLMRIHYE